MSKKSYVPLNVLAVGSAPSGEYAGDLYFNTATGALNVYDGEDWVELSVATSPDDQFSTSALTDLTRGLDGGEIVLRQGVVYVTEQTIAYSGDSPSSSAALSIDGGSATTDFPNIDGGSAVQTFAFTDTISGGTSTTTQTVVIDAGGV